MRYNTVIKNGTMVFAAFMLTLTACHKSDTPASSTSTTALSADDNGGYASDAAKAETTNNDVLSIADAAASSGATNLQRTTSGYPTVTFTVVGSDSEIIINYGPTDHLCLDGSNRRGEIIVTYSGHYKDSGSVHQIGYNNYYLNDNQVRGGKTVTNMGTNMSGQVWYTVSVNDTLALSGSDSIITWVGSRTRTWLAGYSTTDRSDDVYAIADNGAPAGVLTRVDGNVFTFTITTPLTVAVACRWIEAGTVAISSTSFTGGDRILNYGATAVCDDEATVTIGSHTYDVTLR